MNQCECGFHVGIWNGLVDGARRSWESYWEWQRQHMNANANVNAPLSVRVPLFSLICIWNIHFTLDFLITLFIWKETICVCVTSNYRLKSHKRCKALISNWRDFCHFKHLYVVVVFSVMLKHDATIERTILFVRYRINTFGRSLAFFFILLSSSSSSSSCLLGVVFLPC